MIFKANKKQLREVAVAAVNASMPIGLGFLHYEPSRVFTVDDFKYVDGKDGLHLDYVQGRMVKISFYPVEGRKGYYSQWRDETDHNYESWHGTYTTYTKLLAVAGITPEVE